MKRLGFLLLLISSLSAQAQTDTPASSSSDTATATPTVWFTAGAAFSSLTNQDGLIESARAGLLLSADYEMPFTSMYSLQVGLAYIQKGEALDAILATPNHKATLQLNYIEIPVLLRANWNVYKVDTVSLFAGPYAAFAVTRKEEMVDNTDLANPVVTTADLSSSTKSMDFGLRVGFAYEIPLNDSWIATGGVSYDVGVMNINNTAGNTIQTRSLIAALGLGMKF